LNTKALTKENVLNCYRIVQECINNTLKHAKATAIRITGEMIENKFQLVIQDNGIGIEKNFLQNKVNTSFGMLNMYERTRIMNGKLHIDSKPGKGTKLQFTIPI
jgi:two-component system, NarL family, sensor histidine kinase DegS